METPRMGACGRHIQTDRQRDRQADRRTNNGKQAKIQALRCDKSRAPHNRTSNPAIAGHMPAMLLPAMVVLQLGEAIDPHASGANVNGVTCTSHHSVSCAPPTLNQCSRPIACAVHIHRTHITRRRPSQSRIQQRKAVRYISPIQSGNHLGPTTRRHRVCTV